MVDTNFRFPKGDDKYNVFFESVNNHSFRELQEVSDHRIEFNQNEDNRYDKCFDFNQHNQYFNENSQNDNER